MARTTTPEMKADPWDRSTSRKVDRRARKWAESGRRSRAKAALQAVVRGAR